MSDEVKAHLKKIGAKGGKTTAKKYGKRHMKELAERSHKVRRERKAAQQ